MKIDYQIVSKDGKVVEEQIFTDICCDDMKKALLAQETNFNNVNSTIWLFCLFCKKEIEY